MQKEPCSHQRRSALRSLGTVCSTLLPTRTYQTTQKFPLHLLVPSMIFSILYAAHCCLLDSTRPDQKLPLHLLEPSLIFLSLYYNNIEVYIALWALHQHALSPLNILSEPKSTAHCKPGHNLVSEASSDHSLWTQSPCEPRLGSSRLPWPQSPAPCNSSAHSRHPLDRLSTQHPSHPSHPSQRSMRETAAVGQHPTGCTR